MRGCREIKDAKEEGNVGVVFVGDCRGWGAWARGDEWYVREGGKGEC